MIKFINLVIRPLGYVCVTQDFIDSEQDYKSWLEKEIGKSDNNLFFNSIDVDKICQKTVMFHFGIDIGKSEGIKTSGYKSFSEKPEYKDNVVPFNKLV